VTSERRMNLSGLSADLKHSIEDRVNEFEQEHEDVLINGGPGWVPRIHKFDYAIAIVISASLTLWLFITLIWD